MAKIQNISEIHPTLGFTEFDIIEKHRKSFHESELGRLHSVFPFERMAKNMDEECRSFITVSSYIEPFLRSAAVAMGFIVPPR